MDNENVVQMPTLLERLATKLKTCLSQEASNREEWIAIQEAKCATLVEIRDQFAADIEFGRWCDDNGFGANVINYDTRAAMISMGRDPVAFRVCLEATTRRALLQIYRKEFEGFRQISKPTRRKNASPKIDAAREAVREFVEDNKPINREKIGEQSGLSPHTIQKAVLYERGRLEGLKEAEETKIEALPIEEMRPTTKQRYEAAIRKARAELRAEITAEISAAYMGMVSQYRQRVADADRIIAAHRGVMSRNAFRRIKACLHPDHNTFTFAAEALQTFSELEKVLVKPDDTAPAAPGLPKTAAEMMARRRQHR